MKTLQDKAGPLFVSGSMRIGMLPHVGHDLATFVTYAHFDSEFSNRGVNVAMKRQSNCYGICGLCMYVQLVYGTPVRLSYQ